MIGPHDLDVEMALLGDLLARADWIPAVAERVAPADFYSPGHGHLFETLVALDADGDGPVDLFVVRDHLVHRHLLDAVGGPQRLVEIQALGAGAWARHAATVAELARRRRVAAAATEVAEAAVAGIDTAAMLDRLTEVAGGATRMDLGVIRLADVEPERVDWLWPGWLPLGKLVMLDGDPSVGKSTLTVDLASRVSTGSPMPDGYRLPSPADVVLLSAEDGPADTIRPRLDAAGGDAARVHLLVDVAELGPDGAVRRRPPSLQASRRRPRTRLRPRRVGRRHRPPCGGPPRGTGRRPRRR